MATATNGDAKILSQDEVNKAKEEIIAGIGEDEFEDAAELDSEIQDGDGNFGVSPEEMSIIRAELACEFPEDYLYLSDAYILSVASKPYSKDPTVRRPLDYSIEKLTHVLQWRKDSQASAMVDLVKLANGPQSAPEAVENPEKLAQAKAVVTAMNYSSIYWHGFTKDGRPVLWVRTNRKPWYPDVESEIKALIAIADAGILGMPKTVTDFVCISDSTSPPPPNPSYMIALLKALVRGYPDRLNLLISAPISSIIQFVMKLLLPLMPGRLASKVLLHDVETMKEKLEDLLLNGKDDIPTFFGGPVDHDKFYPEESYCPNRGQGNLKFDYFGMIERLGKDRDEFEKLNPSK
mmetsp:Transcript_6433/g.9374  ORF Transcript_6433/g.9374 Transcript_6433/m.9374 type:complete len:349 (-) Transcript_6433:373-1419(-)|eukprot:CAMPEP_0195508984 /NCGR_PEP_ID=MMETSP0794_2-20130614/2051_1 /TAXON_ID=515487 /ORGANISM="Stephanopyxis turris, Strain CCMP 815" /LENGTH=348 /DNA_ID=CAMNT_0040636089 /DNA_START=95 /DNA_END=1141 /DNA_ORIENTATION=+